MATFTLHAAMPAPIAPPAPTHRDCRVCLRTMPIARMMTARDGRCVPCFLANRELGDEAVL